ncbi:formylglycine-generating enzyme family protein [Marilutibacter alkalisoli]|uniref:Formylglycine-generating enzyme family protein n=1 Tax=Marilutibacter alkalisoli TaxID=2591633 RepID=A0A514BSS6_9GAMM|nr:formylglycine-generating enzyme family protein [Lysobacter alkalisoli]QDH70443.1 formylglycine-generating enzyme family protein [Lysobacter alkalisoli]
MNAVTRPANVATLDEAPAPGMVWVPPGEFRMGSDYHYPEEAPAHPVEVDGFWMDIAPVTNAQFRRFVEATGYVTFCEVPPNEADYPNADPALLVAASVVFVPPPHRVGLHDHYQWWQLVPGADWRHPQGPDSSIDGRDDHPVVHVAYADIEAYARWAGKQLPTEAEFEWAARGGGGDSEYAWGDELAPGGKHLANTWQGEFPWQNLAEDGHIGTSPVGAYPASAYGLVDLIGNVWEWTCDWYSPRHPQAALKACCIPSNPRGGARDASYDPAQPHIRIPRKVMKGGSHLCAPNYCQRYRPAARMSQPVDTSTSHLGFRCVVRSVTSGE